MPVFEDGSSLPDSAVAYGPSGWYRTDGGGYRPPANPAPVSGPGELSQRTDGGPGQPIRDLPNAKYGENQEYVAMQQGAPMAKQPGPPPPPDIPDRPPPAQLPPLTELHAPTDRPHEPITAGARLGPGPGPASMGMNLQPGRLSQALSPYFAEDETGYVRLIAEDLAEMGM